MAVSAFTGDIKGIKVITSQVIYLEVLEVHGGDDGARREAAP